MLKDMFAKKGSSASANLAEVDGRIATAQSAQRGRDERRKTLDQEAGELELDSASGDAIATARLDEIDLECATLDRAAARGARYLAELADIRAEAQQAVQVAQDAARVAEAIKLARSRLKALPGQIDELRKMQARAQEIMIALGASGGVFPAGLWFNLDAVEHEAREHLEYQATPGAEHPNLRRQREAREAEARAVRENKERLATPLKFDIDAAFRKATPEELERVRLYQSAREGERRNY